MVESLNQAGVAPSSSPTTAFAPGKSYASGPGLSASDIRSTRIVAYAVRCSADFKIGDREFSGELDLHEVVCLRRKYDEMGGGTITLRPEWKPALQRLMPLTQGQLAGLAKAMRERHMVARQGGGVLDIFAIYFGAEEGLQLKRLHEVLRLQREAWDKLIPQAIARIALKDRPDDQHRLLATAYEMITTKELEGIVRIADPSTNDEGVAFELPEASQIDVPLVTPTPAPAAGNDLESLQRQAAADADAADASSGPQREMIDRLVNAGKLNHSQALAVATLHELMEGEIPDGDLSDAIGSLAKGRLDAVRRALKP